MAPMLEDEIMHDTEKMNSKVAGIARTGKQIYDFIEQLKRAKNTVPEISDNGLPFLFPVRLPTSAISIQVIFCRKRLSKISLT